MAKAYTCDRCNAVASECESVRGRDLCPVCIVSLEAWLAVALKTVRKKGRTHRPRNPPEASMEAVRVLAEVYGKVSAGSLADATGESYRASYLRLRHLCRKGLIERVAGCVYRLPSAMGEAAE